MADLRLLPEPPAAVPGVWPVDPQLQVNVGDLVDAELRLLARATGEHLPAELAAQVLELRARRARAGL
ncbi:hypothetical protein GKE82_24540 [Conexibacter sp. W3-3-2]|uniref:hypothetical protein n=1 Tax=Conexibacter sp. W3-3-2 TaxID=2675227 RepID=UPI0012B7583A|nr:hypothetical protein [Conexibacter sp. W3-3-2]MTD45593.1 hypothetical protein [Conexibacter sp. W3-3-2]MTD47378.1 hypothetical protein [Conexibacter sp. W3-3-2]